MATAASILDLVEDMPATVSGLLLFGTEARSSVGVCVVGQSICWAAATRDRRTLTSYLRQHAGLELGDNAINDLYRACASDGSYAGETLLERGAIERAGLQSALLAQAVDALAAIDEDAGSPYFLPSYKQPPTDRISVAELRQHIRRDSHAVYPPRKPATGVVTASSREPSIASQAPATSRSI